MKNKFKTLFVLPILAGVLTGCSLEVQPDSTALMTAINYNKSTRITYQEDKEYHTPGTPECDKDNPHYNPSRQLAKGDYKPVWNAVQNRLGISLLEHQAAANSGEKKSVDYFRDNWLLGPYADMSMGTVVAITNYSVSGNKETILDLKPYLDETKFDEQGEVIEGQEGKLPHLAKFLNDNPGVKMSVVTAKHSHPEKGAIYYIPYLDCFNDLEYTTLMRADYTKRLLDDQQGIGYFSDDTKILGKEGEAKYSQHYAPFYVSKTEGDKIFAPEYTIPVPNVNDNGKIVSNNESTLDVTKKETESIISRQNRTIKDGQANSITLINQFKEYLKDRYGVKANGEYPFGSNASDLFLGWKACYDVDELVALMRIVKVSAKSIFGKDSTKEMVPYMPRAWGNDYSSDMYRWAGPLFGVRGTNSRNGYLYLNGTVRHKGLKGEEVYHGVHDCRGDESTLNMIKKLREMYQEGLLLQEFDSQNAVGTSNGKFAESAIVGGGNDKYAGFMEYDFSQNQGELNRKEGSYDKKTGKYWTIPENEEHEYEFRPIIGPVTHWETNPDVDGEAAYEWMQFSESLNSLKTSALCLNADLVNNKTKLDAAFKFVEYMYSPEGQFLMNFGPWEDGYITEKAGLNHLDPKYNPGDDDFIMYQGKRIPKFTTEATEQYESMDSWQRSYTGATFPMGYAGKMKGMEYQLTHPHAQRGLDRINTAIECGTYKHVLVGTSTPQQKEDYKKAFFHIAPTAFFLTKGQVSEIAEILNKNKLGSMYTDSDTSNFNIWDSYVMSKESQIAPPIDKYLETVNGDWQCPKLVAYYQDAYEIMAPSVEG